MDLGMIGLGRMGANMAKRLVAGGHRVVATDRAADAVLAASKGGAIPAASPSELRDKLKPPRAAWVMVPSGDPTEQTVKALGGLLEPDDVLLDGGNSNYKDSMRRGAFLADRGIHFLDVGTSGGIWGVTEGYCLMIGGSRNIVGRLRPIFETLAPAADRGWLHVGASGSGHFVKMIHNGIEYGMMQALAEGFAILKKKQPLAIDVAAVAEVWRHGSVVRSWLLDLTARALAESPDLAGVAPWVSDSGEGRWTVAEAMDLDVPAPVITHALLARLRSRDAESYADRLLAAMRNQFGGHEIRKAPAR
jgi:6-phosphogluconate dehydrogenase